jgi:hypothetical protein
MTVPFLSAGPGDTTVAFLAVGPSIEASSGGTDEQILLLLGQLQDSVDALQLDMTAVQGDITTLQATLDVTDLWVKRIATTTVGQLSGAGTGTEVFVSVSAGDHDHCICG